MTLALTSRKKAVPRAVAKANKPALAVKAAPSSLTHPVDKLLEAMTLIPWDPFRGFQWPSEYELPTRIPYLDVIDSDNEYVVKAELPALKKETLNIQVGTNELSLAAEFNVETEEKVKTYLHMERDFSTFRRSIGFRKHRHRKSISKNG